MTVSTDDTPYFLAPDYVRVTCEDCAFPPDVVEAVQRCAARVLGNRALREMAVSRCETLYRAEPFPRAELREWPLLANERQPEADLFYVLVALAGLPEMRALFRERAIPEDVYRAGLTDV